MAIATGFASTAEIAIGLPWPATLSALKVLRAGLLVQAILVAYAGLRRIFLQIAATAPSPSLLVVGGSRMFRLSAEFIAAVDA